MVASGRVDPTGFITHRFALDDMAAAYDTLGDPKSTGALKAVLSRS
ncbi:hypothetical protein GCM10020001_112770 [Nonomuraea salmonea]